MLLGKITAIDYWKKPRNYGFLGSQSLLINVTIINNLNKTKNVLLLTLYLTLGTCDY